MKTLETTQTNNLHDNFPSRVIPAQAGIQSIMNSLFTGFRVKPGMTQQREVHDNKEVVT